jgi:pSer/pThr/pTyr-binding forkhead associated (FHA) protein
MRTVREHVLELGKSGLDGLRLRVTVPVLVELALQAQPASEFLTKPLTKPLMRETVEDEDALSVHPRIRDDATVHYVRKRPNGAFPDRIGIGRTGTDIVLAFPLISKYHAYIRQEGKLWLLSDAGSRNGTFVDRERLGPGEARPLRERCDLRLGPYGFRFLMPEAFLMFLAAR